jgi:hypothetical protein
MDMEATTDRERALVTLAVYDVDTELSAMRRTVRQTNDLLIDALAALRNGDLNVTEEFLDRSILALTRAGTVAV